MGVPVAERGCGGSEAVARMARARASGINRAATAGGGVVTSAAAAEVAAAVVGAQGNVADAASVSTNTEETAAGAETLAGCEEFFFSAMRSVSRNSIRLCCAKRCDGADTTAALTPSAAVATGATHPSSDPSPRNSTVKPKIAETAANRRSCCSRVWRRTSATTEALAVIIVA